MKNHHPFYPYFRHSFLLVFLSLFLSACEMSDSDFSSDTGTGGSTARFTIVGDYLYTVDFTNLNTFDIIDPSLIEHKQRIGVGFGIETIFPYENKLFLGAQNGLYIYDLTSPSQPDLLSFTTHFESRDPVVVSGNRAYVTLNSWNSQLQMYDITNLSSPERINTFPLDDPYGLAVKDSLLFVCDWGIKVFNTRNDNLSLIHHYDTISARDLILKGDLMIVTGPGGLSQYQISDNNSLTFLSKLSSATSLY